MQKNVVVAGYPKSGTTWLTRLTAELIGCPIEGFWGEPDGVEIAVEGEGRLSSFKCYKSHHQLHELGTHSAKDIEGIVYIVRDPRDVVLSGSRYFRPPRWGIVGRAARRIPYFKETFIQRFNTSEYRIKRMTKAVLEGDAGVNHWCRVPWRSHVKPYTDSNHLFLRYEDLLSDPEELCRQILDHLGLNRSEKHIEHSVYRQSLEYKRKAFIKKGEHEKAEFMKQGTQEQWKDELPQSQARKIEIQLTPFLERLRYPVEDNQPPSIHQ